MTFGDQGSLLSVSATTQEPHAILVALDIVVPIFAVAFIGYGAVKLRWFPLSATEGVARFVFDFAVPAMLFRAMATAEVFDNPPWALWAAFFPASLIVFASGFAIAKIAFMRGFDGATITGMGSCFGNTLLLGIPINILVLGEAGALPSLLIIAAHSLVLMTVTTVMLEVGRADGGGFAQTLGRTLRGMASNPVIGALLCGLLWNAGGVPIPGVIDAVLNFLRGAVVPCSLFALGATLARYGFKGRLAQSLVVTGLKLCVMPALVWVAAAHVLHLDPVWTAAAVLMAAQPTGVNMYLFASRYETAEAIASTTIFVSTLVAMPVLPLLIALVVPTP